MTDILITERADPAVSVVRTFQQSESLYAALGQAFAVRWPTTPNTSASAGATSRVLWMAPTEWAILGLEPADVLQRVRDASGSHLVHVADMSNGLLSVRIGGPRARDLIAKGCSLDLHPRSFKLDACAQTLMAQTFVLLHQPERSGEFELFVDASLRDHFCTWLEDAAAEFRPGR